MVSKEIINNIINEVINDYSILKTKCSIIKSSPYYTIAIELSNKYGLQLKKCTNTELRFLDTSNHHNPLNPNIKSTELRFDEYLHERSSIDFFGDEEYDWKYSLDDILGYYDSMPQSLKNSASLIAFEDTGLPCTATIYDPVQYHKENVVRITRGVLEKDEETPSENVERAMAHELAHCFEMSQLTENDKRVLSRVVREVETIDDKFYFDNHITPKMHTYSKRSGPYREDGGGVFGDAVDREAIEFGGGQIMNVMPSTYASSYYPTQPLFSCQLAEHFAETVSMVSFKNKKDKTNARITTGTIVEYHLGNEQVLDYDNYVSNEKQSYSIPVVEDLIFNQE